MTRATGRGACDPCCTDWKQKIKELWENYQEIIKGIKAGPDTVYPDGNGIADIDDAIENEVARQISDESLVTSEDLQTAIADMATIQDLDSGLSTLQSTKQDKLVNQVNIKSVNGVSLLGSGDVQVSVDSVAWDDVTDKPEFAEVATSGSYDDLTDKPSIPAAQVNADWDATEGVAEILNKPTIPAAQVNSDWDATSGVAQILNKPTLATVATTGDYDDLIDKPTIPSGADLVPSTSGITDGYVLTNDNGTPAWKAGGGGGSGMTAHVYTDLIDLVKDIVAHPNGIFRYSTATGVANVALTNIVASSVTFAVTRVSTGSFGYGTVTVYTWDPAAATKSVSLTGMSYDSTNQTVSNYSSTFSLNVAYCLYCY